jgi:DNA-binding beta-propeller fold protein YncE
MVAAFLAVAPSAQAEPFAYVANESSHDVSQYDVGAGGLLSPLSPPAVAADPIGNPQGVAVRPNGLNVYVTNGFTGTVSQYDVGAGGALTPKSPPAVATGSFPQAVAVSPDGGSVYVANASSDTVSQYDVGGGGALTPKSPPTVTASSSPVGVAISPHGDSVYVTTAGSGTVSQYDVGAGGALTAKSPPAVAAAGNARGIVISPEGDSVYVTTAPRAAGSEKLVFQYDVGAGGILSPKSPPTVTAGATPVGVAISPDGTSVYVTNVGSFNVSQYDVGSSGALVPKSPATVAAGRFPFGVVVSPDGGSVYVTNDGDNNVSQYDVDAGGALAPKSSATVAAGGGPVAVAVSFSNRPPRCSGVHADPDALFPATRDQFKTVTLSGASDLDGDALSFHIDGVSQDEPITGPGIGDDTFPDAQFTAAGANSNQVSVRAERNPMRNGRAYRIAYTVSDGNGGSCSRSNADTNAMVSVPRKKGETAVDDAPPSYNSFTGAPLP